MSPALISILAHLAWIIAYRSFWLLVFATMVVQATRTRTMPLADFLPDHIRRVRRRRLAWTILAFGMFGWIIFLWGGSEAGAQVCMGVR